MDANVIKRTVSASDSGLCVCGGVEGTLDILKDVQRAYEERLSVVERVGGARKLQMQVEVLQSWVSDVVAQNALLACALEEVEQEAIACLARERTKHNECGKRKKPSCNSKELKALDSLQKENLAKDREIRRLIKDLQTYEQTIVNLRNEISMCNYHTPDVTKKDAEIMAGLCCSRAECGDAESLHSGTMLQEESKCQDRIRQLELNLKSSGQNIRALRKVNVVLSEELHAMRRVCAFLDEQSRNCTMRAQFKDEIIREMRRQLKQAKAKLKESGASIKSHDLHDKSQSPTVSYDSVTIACVRQQPRKLDPRAGEPPLHPDSDDCRSPRFDGSGDDESFKSKAETVKSQREAATSTPNCSIRACSTIGASCDVSLIERPVECQILVTDGSIEDLEAALHRECYISQPCTPKTEPAALVPCEANALQSSAPSQSCPGPLVPIKFLASTPPPCIQKPAPCSPPPDSTFLPSIRLPIFKDCSVSTSPICLSNSEPFSPLLSCPGTPAQNESPDITPPPCNSKAEPCISPPFSLFLPCLRTLSSEDSPTRTPPTCSPKSESCNPPPCDLKLRPCSHPPCGATHGNCSPRRCGSKSRPCSPPPCGSNSSRTSSPPPCGSNRRPYSPSLCGSNLRSGSPPSCGSKPKPCSPPICDLKLRSYSPPPCGSKPRLCSPPPYGLKPRPCSPPLCGSKSRPNSPAPCGLKSKPCSPSPCGSKPKPRSPPSKPCSPTPCGLKSKPSSSPSRDSKPNLNSPSSCDPKQSPCSSPPKPCGSKRRPCSTPPGTLKLKPRSSPPCAKFLPCPEFPLFEDCSADISSPCISMPEPRILPPEIIPSPCLSSLPCPAFPSAEVCPSSIFPPCSPKSCTGPSKSPPCSPKSSPKSSKDFLARLLSPFVSKPRPNLKGWTMSPRASSPDSPARWHGVTFKVQATSDQGAACSNDVKELYFNKDAKKSDASVAWGQCLKEECEQSSDENIVPPYANSRVACDCDPSIKPRVLESCDVQCGLDEKCNDSAGSSPSCAAGGGGGGLAGACDAARAQYYRNKLLATLQILRNKEETVRVQGESISVAEARITTLSIRAAQLRRDLDCKSQELRALRRSAARSHSPPPVPSATCHAAVSAEMEVEKYNNIVNTLQDNLSVIEELYRESFYETAKQEELIEMLRKACLDVRLMEKEKSKQIGQLQHVINTQKWSLEQCQDIAVEVDSLKLEISNFLSSSNNDSGMWERSESSLAAEVGEDLQDILEQLLQLRDMLAGGCTCGLEEENKRLREINAGLEMKVDELCKRSCDLEAALKTADNLNKQYKKKLEENEQEIHSARQQLTALQERDRERECARDCLIMQLQQEQALLKERTAELAAVREQCAGCEQTVRQLREKLGKADELIKDNCKIRDEVSYLTQQVSQWRQQLDESRARVLAVEDELRRAHLYCRNVDECYQEKASCAAALQEQLEAAHERGAELCAEARRVVCTVRHWVRKMRAQHSEQENKLKEQEEKIKEQECLINTLQQSVCPSVCLPARQSVCRVDAPTCTTYRMNAGVGPTREDPHCVGGCAITGCSKCKRRESAVPSCSKSSRTEPMTTTPESSHACVSEKASCSSGPVPPRRLLRKKVFCCGDKRCKLRTRVEMGVQSPLRSEAGTSACEPGRQRLRSPRPASPTEELFERVERLREAMEDGQRRWSRLSLLERP